MKKNGFTLIELIGTIILLSLLTLIIMPTVNRVIKNSKIDADNQQVLNIVLAARNWAADNTKALPTKGTSKDVSILELQKYDYLDSEIKKPSTNEIMGGCVNIKNTSNTTTIKQKYDYTYQEDNSKCLTEYTDNGEISVVITAKEIINGIEQANEYNGNWTRNPIKLIADVKSNGNPFPASKYMWRKGTDNNEISTTPVNTKTVYASSEEGQVLYYVSINGKDYFGPKELKIDAKAPAIVVFKTQNSTNDTISFTITDNGSGVAAYQLTTNKNTPTNWISLNGNPRTYSDEVTKSSGIYYMWSKDSAGNISLPTRIIVLPRCKITLEGAMGDNGWYKSNVTVMMTSNGDTTVKGLATTKKSTNGKTSVVHTADTDNITYYGYVSNDLGAGECSKTFKMDKTAPSIAASNSNPNWTSGSVVISALVTDHGSGPAQTTYRYSETGTDYSDWDSGSTPESVVGTWAAERDATVYIAAKDKAGNLATRSAGTVKIDKTGPSISPSNSTGGSWTSGTVVISANYSDSASGVNANKVYYYYPGGGLNNDWDAAPTTSYVKGTWSANREQEVIIRVYDNVGNYTDSSAGYVRIGYWGCYGCYVPNTYYESCTPGLSCGGLMGVLAGKCSDWGYSWSDGTYEYYYCTYYNWENNCSYCGGGWTT